MLHAPWVKIVRTLFQARQVISRDLPQHVICKHSKKKRQKDCAGCVSKTMQGLWKDRIACWHKEKNGGLEPFDVLIV
jgi:hypothetical protein